jgi:hypothetical protein
MPIPNERGETWRDVVKAWWPIHKDRMEKLHQPSGDIYTVIQFFETIELAQKEEQDRLAKIEQEKEIIDIEVSGQPDD